MFNRLKELFSLQAEGDAEDDGIEVPMAAAMLLLEVAWADHEIEAAEIGHVELALASLYGLEAPRIAEVVAQARADHESSTGMQTFTRLLTEQLTRAERQALLTHLWRVASFDGDTHHYEEHIIRKITDLLYLNHSDFIAAKRAVKHETGGAGSGQKS